MSTRRKKRSKWGTGISIGIALGFSFGFITGAYFFYMMCGLVLGIIVDWNRNRK
ncbi:hypothetical protein JCM19046_795 [Bacillus sp. JCM 19046]|uniref:Glycine zipper-like domain-containing protein n=1 Tax=Shouchella xiaoxiensis TaxID=766895 RepID=A0ABS2SWU6_9BACI|nr:hypothetical protein [Shouchella xiaoxiensis]MBM7839656.1 hypothetical protein [Shouchella xiaoxiensis]GAF13184.1 hypothetical protein JCM19045_2412 [Bacillus sp. JCM 19045]GAF16366.1 hypothetical protein JCM19046_795 [Bacillus sp. JCM 19046]